MCLPDYHAPYWKSMAKVREKYQETIGSRHGPLLEGPLSSSLRLLILYLFPGLALTEYKQYIKFLEF